MDEAVLRLRVGLFVLIAMVILGILIFLFSEGWKQQYVIYVKPPKAPGVTKDTPIRKNGILIGRVGNVQTVDQPEPCVLLTLKINQGEQIFEYDRCSIGVESVLGDSVVEIIPPDKPEDRPGEAVERGNPLNPGDSMTLYAIKRNPMELVDLAVNLGDDVRATLNTVRDAGNEVSRTGLMIQDLSNDIRWALNDDEGVLKNLVRDINAASKSFDAFFEKMNAFLPEDEKTTREQIWKFVEGMTDQVPKITSTIEKIQETTSSFKDNSDNIKKFTESLRDTGPEITRKIETRLDELGELIIASKEFTENFRKFGTRLGDALNDPNSSIYRILQDDQMYDDISETVRRIKMLSVKLEPLMNDARSFADSISRNPSQLGLGGAIKPNSGYKSSAGRNSFFRQ